MSSFIVVSLIVMAALVILKTFCFTEKTIFNFNVLLIIFSTC